MASSVPANPTSNHVAAILPKLQNADPDIRYMSLNDLSQMLIVGQPNFLLHDYTTCARVIDGLLHTLNDQNGDVQNMAIKCLGPFVNRAPESILSPLFEKITTLRTDNTVDTSITALAVRAVVVALPRPVPGTQKTQKVQESYSAISRALIPRLVGYNVMPPSGKVLPAPPKGMLQIEMETGQDTNAMEVLTEVARCFGPMLQEPEVQALQKITMEILESPKCGTVIKKKAVQALSLLAAYFSDGLLSHFVSYSIEVLRQSTLGHAQRKLYITIYGSMARSIPQKFGPYLMTLAPFVLAPLSQDELDQHNEEASESDEAQDPQIEEVREAALVALDAFEAFCGDAMLSYTKETIDAALRFLKYDPNYANDDEDMDDDDNEDDDMEFDEEFEEETGFDDEDDMSWKVRRCSAKLLHTLASVRSLVADGTLYERVAPALISRFSEREESVRLEVLHTLTYLIKITDDAIPRSGMQHESGLGSMVPLSRKRRRGSSSAGISDSQASTSSANGYASPTTPPPQTAPQKSLADLNPDITKSAAKLLRSSTVPTKQAVITLLAQMIIAQRGGLSRNVNLVVEPIVEAMKNASGASGSSNATQQTLRIEALTFLRALADTHSSKILQPYLGRIVPGLITVCTEKYSKVAVEAFDTTATFIKAITPPRAASTNTNNGAFLQQFYEVITARISASDTDTEVRQKAIIALGLLVGRTSGSKGTALLSQDNRFAGMEQLADRLRNDLTRLASVRAIDTIATLTHDKGELQAEWTRNVALELGAQLRKANRSLRGSSLVALRTLALNSACRENLDNETIKQLVSLLLPLINDVDLHLLGPALITLGTFAKDRPDIVLNSEVISGFCFVAKMDLHGASLAALLSAVEIIGQQGHGKQLMQAMLKEVGVSGNPEIVGQVIGTLLVAGGSGVGVSLEDFKSELSGSPDEKRKCLALYILGEAGLRRGSACSLKPQDFTSYFEVGSDKVHLAAAIALGRAGAGNVSEYLPQILSTMGSGKQYLLLHSIKEMLQHSTAEAEILAHSKNLWDNIITAAQGEDNKSVGAECIGRLAIIDPSAYLPQLQVSFESRQYDSTSTNRYRHISKTLNLVCAAWSSLHFVTPSRKRTLPTTVTCSPSSSLCLRQCSTTMTLTIVGWH